MGFNTPLVPEVLIVTTVGQEGIDLHRECCHVIHHDLPWNPATLSRRRRERELFMNDNILYHAPAD